MLALDIVFVNVPSIVLILVSAAPVQQGSYANEFMSKRGQFAYPSHCQSTGTCCGRVMEVD